MINKLELKEKIIDIYKPIVGQYALNALVDKDNNRTVLSLDFSSIMLVLLIVKIETSFDIEIPFEMMDHNTFIDISAVTDLVYSALCDSNENR